MDEKRSYGIICCTYIDGLLHILLIKRANSYHFCSFVMGKYHSDKDLVSLFNNMTGHEKITIMSLRFSSIWYSMHLEDPETVNSRRSRCYLDCKSKFEKYFLTNRNKLIRLISNTTTKDTIWEIPKGRRKNNEQNITTAMREFEEETKIPSDKYEVLLHVDPVQETFVDYGTTYVCTYYFAVLKDIRNAFELPPVNSIDMNPVEMNSIVSNPVDMKNNIDDSLSCIIENRVSNEFIEESKETKELKETKEMKEYNQKYNEEKTNSLVSISKAPIWEPSIHFNDKNQIREISDIKWRNRQQISNMLGDKPHIDRLLRCIDRAAKVIKKEFSPH